MHAIQIKHQEMDPPIDLLEINIEQLTKLINITTDEIENDINL